MSAASPLNVFPKISKIAREKQSWPYFKIEFEICLLSINREGK